VREREGEIAKIWKNGEREINRGMEGEKEGKRAG
jgi:hypothetical protein